MKSGLHRYFVNTGRQTYASWSGYAANKKDAIAKAKQWLKVKQLPRGTQVWRE